MKKPARCQQCKKGKAVVWKEVGWVAPGVPAEICVCEKCGRKR